MSLKKWMGFFAAGGVATACAVSGCSSSDSGTPVTATDAGEGGTTLPEAGRRDTGTTDSGGPACTPQAVANPLTPTPAYKPYLKSPVCTTTQISDYYEACYGANASQTTCTNWENANTACDECLNTPASAAQWGETVLISNTDFPDNYGGCFGIVLNEGASTTGCGAARWAYDRCLVAACPDTACFADPANPTTAEQQAYDQCTTDAEAGPCKPAVDALNTKCAALDNDATAAVLEAACGISESTYKAQLLKMAATFCGGATGDAGGGG